jgi:hypothetical protein
MDVEINMNFKNFDKLKANSIIKASQFEDYSDYRIKENPIPIDQYSHSHIFTIDNLQPLQYFNKLTNQINLGLIAHEVHEYFPFLVTGNKDDSTYQSINYVGLIPLLIHEINELKTRYDKIENKLENIV